MNSSGYCRNNSVHLVGYALEKVHTGILAGLLDFEGNPTNIQRRLLEILVNDSREFEFSIAKCRAFREYRVGANRADLLLVIDGVGGEVQCCCIEAKVDSEIRELQLDQLFEGDPRPGIECQDERWSYAVLAMGASRFTWPKDGYGEWQLVTPVEILSVLEDEPHSGVWASVLRDWSEALRDELGLQENMRFLKDGSKEGETRKLGHARWFGPYAAFRSVACGEGGNEQKWFNIYSAGHNPVCNEDRRSGESWVSLNSNSQFFWEFNSGDLFLKVKHENQGSNYPGFLGKIKDVLVCELNRRNPEGGESTWRRCPDRKSKQGYFSILRWPGFLAESGFREVDYWQRKFDEYVRVQSEVNEILNSCADQSA